MRKRRLPLFSHFFLFSTLFFGLVLCSNAVLRTWTNGGGDGLWTNASNWNPSAQPQNGDTLVFDGAQSSSNSVADLGLNLAELRFQNSYTGKLTVSHNIVVNSSVTLPLGASIVLSSGSLTIESTATNGLYLQGAVKWDGSMTANATLNVKGLIKIVNLGALQIGSTSFAIPSNLKASLVLNSSNTAGSAGIEVNNGGKFEVYGSSLNAFSETKLSISAGANNFEVVYATDIANWNVGDTITVAQLAVSGTDQTERRTITSISGATIGVDAPFSYAHSTGVPVNNLSRNVRIHGMSPSFRSYIQNLSTDPNGFVLKDAELYNLGVNVSGRTGITFDGAGVRGSVVRCSIHDGYEGIHLRGASNITLEQNQIYFNVNSGILVNMGGGYNTITKSDSYSNGAHGIYLDNSSNNVIEYNDMYSNSPYGIFISNGSNNNIVDGSDMFSNLTEGLIILDSDYNVVADSNFFKNNGKGVRIYNSDRNTLDGCGVFENSSFGVWLDNAHFNIVYDVDSYSNNSYGVYLSSANNNIFVFNEIRNNSLYGIEMVDSVNNRFARNVVHSNSNVGLHTSNSFDNVFIDGTFGYDLSLVSLPNTGGEIQFSNSLNRLLLKNVKVNPAVLDIDATNLASPGRSLISYRHNQASGTTVIYGDLQLNGESFLMNYNFHTYVATATMPLLMKGTGHSASVSGVSDAFAQTQLITIERDLDNKWHVEGSQSGPDMIPPFTGNQVNVPVPSSNPQFYLTFNEGGTPQHGDIVAFLLMGASADSGVQKKLSFAKVGPNPGSSSRLTIPSGRIFQAIGDPSNPTLIDWVGAGATYYSIVSSGDFTAQYATFTHLASAGIEFTGNSSIEISSVTFDFAASGFPSTYLTANGLVSNETFYNVHFNDTAGLGPYNVRAVGDTSNLNWTFQNWSGSRGGPAFEDDPNGRVHWIPSGGGETILSATFTAVFHDFIEVTWTPIQNASYLAVLSTSAVFSTVVSSGSTGFNTRGYSNLVPNTTYYFKVKLSTASDAAYSVPISTVTKDIGENTALRFDGTNDQRVTVSDHSQFHLQGASRTIEFWFRRNQTTTAVDEYLLSKDDSAKSSGWAIFIKANENKLRFEPLGVGGGLTMSSAVVDTAWHHVAITRDPNGSDTRFYLDGLLQASGPTLNPTAHAFPMKFGNSENLSNDFNGVMDEVRIWSTVRTQTEIQSKRYQYLNDQEPGLIGYWDMDDSPNQIVEDISTTRNNGVRGPTSGPETGDPAWVVDPIPGFGAPQDNTPPTIRILNPLHNSSPTVSALQTLSGTAQDNYNVTDVQVKLKRSSDGALWNFVYSNWDYIDMWYYTMGVNNWSISGGNVVWSTATTYTLYARATDGNFKTAIDTATFSLGIATDTIAPSVSILYPVHGSTSTPDQLTILSGTVQDNQAVGRVRIKLVRSDNLHWNAFQLSWTAGEHWNDLSNPPYNWSFFISTIAWSQAGAYTMTAQAEDLAGNLNASTVTFHVSLSSGGTGGGDGIVPVVRILHPIVGSAHPPAALVNLNGTASDNNGLIHVAARILDIQQNRYWDGGAFSSTAEVWFHLYFNGNPTPWNFAGIPVESWINGRSYQLTVQARDVSDNVGVQSSSFTVNSSSGDTIAPTIYVVSPANGGAYTPATLSIHGTASDNIGLKDVKVSLKHLGTGLWYDGQAFTLSNQNYHLAGGLSFWSYYVPAVAFGNANYLLDVLATDTSTNQRNHTLTFTITGSSDSSDNVPPTVAISSPVNGAVYNDPIQLTNLQGTSADNAAVFEVRYSIKDDANKYWDGYFWSSDTELFLPTYHTPANWQAGMPVGAWRNGLFTMKARAIDTSNNVGTATITFTVQGSNAGGTGGYDQPPIVFLYNPPQGIEGPPYIFTHADGRAEHPAGIDEVVLSLKNLSNNLYFDGSSFTATSERWGAATMSSGTYSRYWFHDIPASIYSNGSYLFRARAHTPAGFYGYASATFTVTGSNGAGLPQSQITFPVSGSTYTAYQLATISGTAGGGSLNYVFVKVKKNSDNTYWNGATWSQSEYWLMASGLNTWTLTTPVGMWGTSGSYSLQAKARNIYNEEGFSPIVTAHVSGSGLSGAPPTVGILFPQNGQNYSHAQLLTLSGTASDDQSVTNIFLRIRDVHMNLDWDPALLIWATGERFFSANYGQGVWTSSRTVYWPPVGFFEVQAYAVDNQSLLSPRALHNFYISNGPGGGDTTPPGQIQQFTAQSGNTVGSINLSWQAPGDDGYAGTAMGYALKYRIGAPILTDADWIAAYELSQPPAPLPSGAMQSLTVQGLTPNVVYFFSIRAFDEAGNRSVLSASPQAVAYNGGTQGTGDGQGTATLSPVSFPEFEQTLATIVVTIGNTGMTNGKIAFRVPHGFVLPQLTESSQPGYVSATASNVLATLTKQVAGQLFTISVSALNPGDRVTITYSAKAPCISQIGSATARFSILTQASSSGQLVEIASPPTATITAGPVQLVGFPYPSKFVNLNEVTTFTIESKNACGSAAPVSSPLDITVNAVKQGTNGLPVTDTEAQTSKFSDFSTPSSSVLVTLPANTSSLPVYYKLSGTGGGLRGLQVLYQLTQQTAENYVQAVVGQGLTGVSVDTGQPGNLSEATIQPANGQMAFINFITGNPPPPWSVEIKDTLNVVVRRFYGSQSPVRLAWDGRREPPYNDMVAGTFSIHIAAGGAQNNSLKIHVQANGVTGTVRDGNQNPIANASIRAYGPAAQRVTQSSADGSFTVAGLAPGTYNIQIEKQGYAPHQTSVAVTGASVSLGVINLKQLAKIIFAGVRPVSSPEAFGTFFARSSAREFSAPVFYADGRNTPTDGITTGNPPVLYVEEGTYRLSGQFREYTVAAEDKTLTAGGTLTWAPAMTANAGVTGTLRLGNGISNQSGFPANLAAGPDADNDGLFDNGYPTEFANTRFEPFGNQAAYSFPGLRSGVSYLIMAFVPGLAPQSARVTVPNSGNATQDFEFSASQGFQITAKVTVNGDSRSLGQADFPVTLRLVATGGNGFTIIKTERLAVNATTTSGDVVLPGVPAGSYKLYAESLTGFRTPAALTLQVGQSMNTALVYSAHAGAIRGTITPQSNSGMSNIGLILYKDSKFLTASPALNGSQYAFANLAPGPYTITIHDTVTSAYDQKSIILTEGQTAVIDFDLSANTYHTATGRVATSLPQPYESLASIITNGRSKTIYTLDGTATLSPLHIVAVVANSHLPRQTLPTVSGTVLDPALMKATTLNNDGTFTIQGLKRNDIIEFLPNNDFSGDGIPDVAHLKAARAITGNISDLEFRYTSGGSVVVSLALPSGSAENGYPLEAALIDQHKNVVRSLNLSVVGSQTTLTFENIGKGRYVLKIIDPAAPAKYIAKYQSIEITDNSERQSISVSLGLGASVKLKLATEKGDLITSANASFLLPTGFAVRVVAKGFITTLTGPSSDGTFSGAVVPGENQVIIEPPQDRVEGGKSFIRKIIPVNVSEGLAYSLGTVPLEKGKTLTGTVIDAVSGTGLSRVPIRLTNSLNENNGFSSQVYTDQDGRFSAEGLNPKERFLTVAANEISNNKSLPLYAEGVLKMVDLDKVSDVRLPLKLKSGSLTGTVKAASDKSLVIGMGSKAGLPGANVLITKNNERGKRKFVVYDTKPDGTFSLPLDTGRYYVEFIAKGHEVHQTLVDVTEGALDLGTISLTAGFNVSGRLSYADGTSPTTSQVAQLVFLNSQKKIYQALLREEALTGTVVGYDCPGVPADTYTVMALDSDGKPSTLGTVIIAQDTEQNFTFKEQEGKLRASFIAQLPGKQSVQVDYFSNLAFLYKPDDLDQDGTADTDEFDNFVKVLQGNGTFTHNSTSQDRTKASYTYVKATNNEVAQLRLEADFTAAELDPKTGTNQKLTSIDTYPLGLEAQNTELVHKNLGDSLLLPNGAIVDFPPDSIDTVTTGTDEVEVKFLAASTLDDAKNAGTGAQAMALAEQLGPAAYPPQMYRAIKTLASAPTVSPLSSFYELFLPAAAKRTFTNAATLTLKYDSSVADPYSLNVYYFNEAQGIYTIENTNRRIDTVAQTIAVDIKHASIFTVLASSASIIQGDSYTGGLAVFNFPNPFDLNPKTVTLQNPGSSGASQSVQGTMIKMSVPAELGGSVEIQIFNVAGERVRTLNTTIATGGTHNYLEWDGTNDHGNKVASGVYIARFTIGGGNERFFKMAVVK